MRAEAPKPIDSMIRAALRAAHIALLRRSAVLKIGEKNENGHISRFTNGDSQSEQIIRHSLEHDCPGIGFIMEETASDISKRGQGMHFVVDPIDGTRGYSRQDRDGPWAVSIALEKHGKTIAAVAYEAAKNEFMTDAQGNDLIYDAARPQGSIFWAAADVAEAWRLDAPAGGFTVTPDMPQAYAEHQVSGLWLLERVPQIAVDYSAAAMVKLRDLPLQPEAGLELDSFHAHPEPQLVLDALTACCREMTGISRCLSAVAGGLRAADGRAAAFINGSGYPWDHSAIRLILQKAGVPMMEYAVAGEEKGRSVLVAGRRRELFDCLNRTVSGLGVTGRVIMAA